MLAALLYGAEARSFTATQLPTYETFWNKVIRGIAGQRIRDMHDDKVTMHDLKKRFGLHDIATYVGERQLRWVGHVHRLPSTRIERAALYEWIEGKCDNPVTDRRPYDPRPAANSRDASTRRPDFDQTVGARDTTMKSICRTGTRTDWSGDVSLAVGSNIRHAKRRRRHGNANTPAGEQRTASYNDKRIASYDLRTSRSTPTACLNAHTAFSKI